MALINIRIHMHSSQTCNLTLGTILPSYSAGPISSKFATAHREWVKVVKYNTNIDVRTHHCSET